MPKNTTKPSATKANTPCVPAPNNHNVFAVEVPGEAPSKTIARTLARCVLDPASLAGSALARINNGTHELLDVNAIVAELQEQARAVSAGNLDRPEAMLSAQAHTLDALFHRLTSWALNNAKEGGNAAYFETCMRLALKAQSQCRATNETLAEIKNPPNVAFVKQANIAAGPQQVNNGVQPSSARENEKPPTKLLEAEHGKRLDTGAALAPRRANQAMEAVGVVNRAQDGGR